jgi:nitrate reductase delta subunit
MLYQALSKCQSPYAAVIEAVSGTLPPATAEDLREVRRLAMQGPPTEKVGLEPFALTIPVRTSVPWAGTARESAR